MKVPLWFVVLVFVSMGAMVFAIVGLGIRQEIVYIVAPAFLGVAAVFAFKKAPNDASE